MGLDKLYSIGQTLYHANKDEFRSVLEEGYIPNFDRRGLGEEELKSLYVGIADAALANDSAIAAKFYGLAGKPEKSLSPEKREESLTLGKIIADTKTRYVRILVDGEDMSKKLGKIRIRKGLEQYAQDYSVLDDVIKGTHSFEDEASELEKQFYSFLDAKRKVRKLNRLGEHYDERMNSFSEFALQVSGKVNILSSNDTKMSEYQKVRIGIYGFGATYFTTFGLIDLAVGNPLSWVFLGFGLVQAAILGSDIKQARKLRKEGTYKEYFDKIKQVGAGLDRYVGYHFDIRVRSFKKDYDPDEINVLVHDLDEHVRKLAESKKKEPFWKRFKKKRQ